MSSSDKLCNQFGPRPDHTKCPACSGTKQFDSLMVFLKEVFERVNLKKKCVQNYTACKKLHVSDFVCSKTCVKLPIKKKDKTKIKTNYSLMKVESNSECSPWCILQYF